MSDPVGLMQAVLGPGTERTTAEDALRKALASGVDPLHWCAVHFRNPPHRIMQRAAHWSSLPFAEAMPPPELDALRPSSPRFDQLSGIRLVAHLRESASLAYIAPDFFGFLRIADALNRDPALRERLCVVPYDVLRDHLIESLSSDLVHASRQTLPRHWPFATAQLDLTKPMRWGFALFMVLLTVLVVVAPFTQQVWLIPFWVTAMVLPTMLRLAALATPQRFERAGRAIASDVLPIYSILVPLRDEANMVDQLCASLAHLDYPPEKLDIIFVVESRSPETIAAVRAHRHDALFSMIVVPDAPPHTKPKALNFALPFCRGEFVVVYDAEDRPDPQQLRQMVSRFRAEPDLECIQARLLIDNGTSGPLPALFTGEYAGLFAVLLPALARWHAVMPLGGTSNHFRLETLRDLGGWDAFNVTEDADLGVRLARRHLRTVTSTSFTLEDAPDRLRPWLGQRTRWLKGWMQTFMVHNRRPRSLLKDLGSAKFLLFELTILSMLLAPLLHIAFLPMALWLVLDGFAGVANPTAWSMACLLMLGLGFAVTIFTNVEGLRRSGQRRFQLFQLLLPFYWLLISWAAVRALCEFVRRPFHWFKTPHQASSAFATSSSADSSGNQSEAPTLSVQ